MPTKALFRSLVTSIAALHERWGRTLFAPPLSEEALTALEARLGGSLPAEYRRFLAEVSAGQIEDPDATGRLYPSGDALMHARGDPRKPFLVTEADAARVADVAAAWTKSGARGSAPAVHVALDGLLPLLDRGDAQCDCLVVHGPLAGQIWHAWDGGLTPQTPGTFAAWIAAHVMEMLAAAPKPLDEGATAFGGAEAARFRTLPPIVARMKKLERVHLSQHAIDGPLPDFFGDAPRMQIFCAHRCGITEVGAWIAAWRELRDLSLTSNRLTSLPEAIGDLPALETLLLNGNELRALPASAKRLRALRDLELGGLHAGIYAWNVNRAEGTNLVAELADDLFEDMPRLTALRLSKNPLRRLPSSLARCPLEVVELAEMPELDMDDALATLARIPTLKKVLVSGRPLARPAPDLSQLTALEDLRLENSGLVAVPESIASLHGLGYLSLANNPITSLPPFLGELPKLRRLGVRGLAALDESSRALLGARFPGSRI